MYVCPTAYIHAYDYVRLGYSFMTNKPANFLSVVCAQRAIFSSISLRLAKSMPANMKHACPDLQIEPS